MKRFLLAAVALVAALAMSVPASASEYHSHTETAWRGPWPTNPQCVRAQAEAQSNDINTYSYWFKATAQAGNDASSDCDTGPGNAVPSGSLAVRMELWRWDGSNWGLCSSTDWSYNPYSTEGWSVEYSGGDAPCGAGWYGIYTYAALLSGGEWHGYDHPVWSDTVYCNSTAVYYTPVAVPLSLPLARVRVPVRG